MGSLELGYTVLSVTIDGKRGLQKVFKENVSLPSSKDSEKIYN